MNNSGLVPLGDRCIVEVLPEETKTKGGIIILDSAVEQKTAAKAEAILVASGEAVRGNVGEWPEDGTHVLITKYAGVRYQPDPEGPDYRIVNWEDIVAYLPEKGTENEHN